MSDAERIAKLEDMVVKLQAQSSASNTVDNNGSGGASHKAPNAKTIQSKQTTKTSSEKKDKKVAHKAISSVELKKDNQTHSQLSTLAAAASKSASENPALQKSSSIVVTNQYDKNSVQAVSSPKNQTNKEPQKKVSVPAKEESSTKQSDNKESENKFVTTASSGQNNNDSVPAKEESSAKQSDNKESENKVVVTSGSGPNHNDSKPEMPAMVTVPCKVKNGKWEYITFNYNELATEKTCWFDVHLRVQTSFVLHGQFAGDILRLSSKFVFFFSSYLPFLPLSRKRCSQMVLRPRKK